VHSQAEQEVKFSSTFFVRAGKIWSARGVNLVVLTCVLRVLRVATKKVVNLFKEKGAHHRKSWLRLYTTAKETKHIILHTRSLKREVTTDDFV